MFMGRTGANPMAGSGGAVLRTAMGPPPPLVGVVALGACSPTGALAEVGRSAEFVAEAADKAMVATSASPAMPSKIVKGLPSVFMATNLTPLAAILASSK